MQYRIYIYTLYICTHIKRLSRDTQTQYTTNCVHVILKPKVLASTIMKFFIAQTIAATVLVLMYCAAGKTFWDCTYYTAYRVLHCLRCSLRRGDVHEVGHQLLSRCSRYKDDIHRENDRSAIFLRRWSQLSLFSRWLRVPTLNTYILYSNLDSFSYIYGTEYEFPI